MILSLIVDRFEGDRAILKTEKNDTVVWPKNKLPEGVKEGATLTFTITGNKNQTKDSHQLAKDILNEILNPVNQTTP